MNYKVEVTYRLSDVGYDPEYVYVTFEASGVGADAVSRVAWKLHPLAFEIEVTER